MAPCVPVSDKLPICKIDVIAIAVITLTVVFLLFCLEYIVKFVRRMLSWKRVDPQEMQSPTQSDGSSAKHLETDDEKDAYGINGTEQVLPLHRYLERTGSDYAQRSRPNLRMLVTNSLSRSFAKVNISRPKPSLARSGDLQRNAPFGISGYQDRHGIAYTVSDCSEETIFGQPPRTSTPPPSFYPR